MSIASELHQSFWKPTATRLVWSVAVLIVALWARTLSASEISTLTKVGDKSPILSMRTVDGADLSLSNKVVVLNFFATWCGPCMQEMPHLQKELWEPLKEKGLVLVSVGREHSVEEVKAFRDKKKFSFQFAADPKREIFSKFATESIPRCVLIGRDGLIKFQSIGFDEKEFQGLISAVEKEIAQQ